MRLDPSANAVDHRAVAQGDEDRVKRFGPPQEFHGERSGSFADGRVAPIFDEDSSHLPGGGTPSIARAAG